MKVALILINENVFRENFRFVCERQKLRFSFQDKEEVNVHEW